MEIATGWVPLIVVCGAAAAAALTDVLRFKVYNILTFPVLFAGLAYHAWMGGWTGALASACGVAAAFAMLILPYILGGLGAGDVKFFMSLGAWLGVVPLVPVFAVGALATGVYAVVLSACGSSLRNLWWSVQVSYMRLMSMGRMFAADDCREDFHDWMDRPDRHRRLIPFSAMLALGLVVTLIWIGDLKVE